MNLFRDEKLLYKGLTSNLSKPVITSLFHKDFIGLNDFVALYTIYVLHYFKRRVRPDLC